MCMIASYVHMFGSTCLFAISYVIAQQDEVPVFARSPYRFSWFCFDLGQLSFGFFHSEIRIQTWYQTSDNTDLFTGIPPQVIQ